MEENEEKHRELIHKFKKIYKQIEKICNVRYYKRFDMHGKSIIEIWEYEGNRKKYCICKENEESEIECYERAIGVMESFRDWKSCSGREVIGNERRTG